jgi:ABC-type multidrug transport system ATPase subunit
MIEIKGYVKKYTTKTMTVNDVKSFKTGFSLQGVNGAGKTTLLKAMANLIPFQGGISIPRPAMYMDASMGLPEGRLKTLKPLFNDKAKTLYATWFQEKEDDLVPKKCSLGMQQKLRLCLALSAPVKTLLLDEPLRGLDQAAIQIFLEALKSETKTVIITSHETFLKPESWDLLEPF